MNIWKYSKYKDVVKIIEKSFEIAFKGEPITSLRESNLSVPVRRVYFILKTKMDIPFDVVKILYLKALEQYIENTIT